MASPQKVHEPEQPPSVSNASMPPNANPGFLVHDDGICRTITVQFSESDDHATKIKKSMEAFGHMRAASEQNLDSEEMLLRKSIQQYQVRIDAIEKKTVHTPQDYRDMVEVCAGMEGLLISVMMRWKNSTTGNCDRACAERMAALISREKQLAKAEADLAKKTKNQDEGLDKVRTTLERDLNKDRQDVSRDRKRLDETKLEISGDRKKWDEEKHEISEARKKFDEMSLETKTDRIELDKMTEELEVRKKEWQVQCVAKFSAEKQSIKDDKAKLKADRQIMNQRDIEIAGREQVIETMTAELAEKQAVLAKEEADWKAREVDARNKVNELDRYAADWDPNIASREDSRTTLKAPQLQVGRDRKQYETERTEWAGQVAHALEAEEKMGRREQALTKRELQVGQREIVASENRGVSKSAEKKMQKREEVVLKTQIDLEQREARLTTGWDELHKRESGLDKRLASECGVGASDVNVAGFEKDLACRERKVEDREFEVQMAEESMVTRESIVRRREQRVLEKEKSVKP